MTLGGLWLCIWRGKIRYAGLVPVMVAILFIPQARKPDILASDTGKLFAVRGTAGKLWFSNLRREKFVRNEWTDLAGGDGTDAWPKPDAKSPPDFLACGEAGSCDYRMKGIRVAFLTEPKAPRDILKRACATADIVFTVDPVKNRKNCTGKSGDAHHAVLIDRWDMYDNGGYAVYLTQGLPPEIVSVKSGRGKRPWTSYR
jgi:competence protein ComEC